MIPVSAYIPCYNNEDTIVQSIASIQKQTLAVAEILVIDDGSSDNSAGLAEEQGVRVIRNVNNQGRGAVRARAIRQAANELVLSLDAGKALAPDFVERSLAWIASPKVASVHGRMVQTSMSTCADRWRARHLFKTDHQLQSSRQACHFTAGSLSKRSILLEVGNYRVDLSALEDRDLGKRLLKAGYEVVFDPELAISALASDNIIEVLERYWRWHAAENGGIDIGAYLRQVAFSIKVMAREDLAAGDLPSVAISLLSPHYQLLRTWWHQSPEHK